MTNTSLASSYLVKARHRLKVLAVLLDDGAFSDVVREAQEVVELALKGMLRQVGVEPPRWHDVGQLLDEHRRRFTPAVVESLPRLIDASGWLRTEREFAFCGDIDFIPTERYSRADAARAVEAAEFAVHTAALVIPGR
jgi:HEPN domain-containing protein